MIDPRTLTAQEWAAQTTPLISQYGTVPVLEAEQGWKRWADIVSTFPALAAVGIVGSTGFLAWRLWALKFNELALLLNP